MPRVRASGLRSALDHRGALFRDVLCLGALLAVLVLSFAGSSEGNSADLLALHAAALAHGAGDVHLVYPEVTGRFTMLPPPEWYAMMEEAGYVGELYPYLYPPLWVALVSPVAADISLASFVEIARFLNHGLVLASIWLAWRITGRPVPLLPFLAVGAAACMLTLPGVIALRENQPQILVGALMLLAIERSGANAPRAAGAALAAAAAIKGFPALLALVWILMRDWRSVTSFAVAGAGFAAASLALAGWPLHAQFLDVLGEVSGTGISTNFSFGLNPLVAQFVPLTADLVVERPDAITDAGVIPQYISVTKGELWASVSRIGPFLVVMAAGLALHNAPAPVRARALWPLTLVALAFVSPIPWTYSYLCALVFVPSLLALSRRLAAVVVCGVLVPLFGPVAAILSGIPIALIPLQVFGTASMAVLAACFWAAGAILQEAERRTPGSAGVPA